MADLCAEEEKFAMNGEGAAKAREVRISWALGRQSIVRGLVVAIVRVVVVDGKARQGEATTRSTWILEGDAVMSNMGTGRV